MAISGSEKIIPLENLEVSFLVDRRLYFEGFKYDFYRKAILPDPEYDYVDITMVGREDPKPRGKKKKILCGKYYGSYICECGHSKESKMNYCFKLGCKICFHKGINRQTVRIIERLEKIEKLEGASFELAHYTFNVERTGEEGEKIIQESGYNIIDVESEKKYKAKLLRVLKKYGFDGILIFHPYRKNRPKMKKLKDGKFYVKKAPHFHAVGRFDSLPNGDKFYEKYKFTYKNISYNEYKKGNEAYPTPYLQNMDHVRNTLKYLLSHTARLSERMNYYSSCGKFSPYYYRKINEVKEMVPKICEKCDSELCKLDKVRYEKIDDLYGKKKNYSIERDYKGIEFNDKFVYSHIYRDLEKVYRVQIHTYDLVRRIKGEKREVEPKYRCYNGTYVRVDPDSPHYKGKEKRACDMCDYFLLKNNGGSNCMMCKNFSNFQQS